VVVVVGGPGRKTNPSPCQGVHHACCQWCLKLSWKGCQPVDGDGVEAGVVTEAGNGVRAVAEVWVVAGQDGYWNLVMAATVVVVALLLVLTLEPQHGVLNLQSQMTAVGLVELLSVDAWKSVHDASCMVRRDRSWLNLNLQTNQTYYSKPQHKSHSTHKDSCHQ